MKKLAKLRKHLYGLLLVSETATCQKGGFGGRSPPTKKEKYLSDCGFCRKHRSDWNLADITCCVQVGNEGWSHKYEIFGVTGGVGVGVTTWAPEREKILIVCVEFAENRLALECTSLLVVWLNIKPVMYSNCGSDG